jgi:hypothetical protein
MRLYSSLCLLSWVAACRLRPAGGRHVSLSRVSGSLIIRTLAGVYRRACALDDRQRCAHPPTSPGAAALASPQRPQGIHQGIDGRLMHMLSSLSGISGTAIQRDTGHRLHVRRSTAQNTTSFSTQQSQRTAPPERYLVQGNGRQERSFTRERGRQSTKKKPLRKTIPMPATPPAAEEPEAVLVTRLTAATR